MIKRAMLLTGLALAIPVAGCGGGDDADAGTIEPSSLSKAQYIKQADMRCGRERQDALNKLGARSLRYGTGNPARAFERGSRQILAPSLERQADAIRALGAPDGDEEQIEALLVEMEQASTALADSPVRGFRGYGARLRGASELASEYGFTQCASSLLI